MGVLDDDGDLGEERPVADVEVLDGVRAEVSLLEHLDSRNISCLLRRYFYHRLLLESLFVS